MVFFRVQEALRCTQMCLSTKVIEDKLCYVFAQFPTCFWRIQNYKSLKMVFFHVGNLPSFFLILFILSFLFHSVHFQNDFKTTVRCLTICKSDMVFNTQISVNLDSIHSLTCCLLIHLFPRCLRTHQGSSTGSQIFALKCSPFEELIPRNSLYLKARNIFTYPKII